MFAGGDFDLSYELESVVCQIGKQDVKHEIKRRITIFFFAELSWFFVSFTGAGSDLGEK